MELQTFLNMHKIDIALISETHFTSRTVLKIPNFKVYHIHYPDDTAHGGAAVIDRNSIPHPELVHDQTDKIQAANIRVTAKPWPFTVTAIYCPPRHAISTSEYTTFFQSQESRLLMGGDWNSKHTNWGARLITPKGRNLLQAIHSNNCEHISTREPTYWPSDSNKIPNLLDFFVLRGITASYIQVESNFELSSDHSPVIATLSSYKISNPSMPTLSTKLTNWENFRNYIDEHINLNLRIKEHQELDEATQHFTTIIQAAEWYSTPSIAEKKNDESNNVPVSIRELVTRKR
jgi:hypothetical protein